MTKMLPATCVLGIVTADGVPVVGATLQSEGVGLSDGVVLLDGDEARYLAKISPDLKTTIGALSDALLQLITALTAIDAKPVGGIASAPSPGAASNIVQLGVIQAQLLVLKETLK